MTATIIIPDFPGNRPSVTRSADEPCVVMILPVVPVYRGPVFERAFKRYARKQRTKTPPTLVGLAPESSAAPEWPFSEGEV